MPTAREALADPARIRRSSALAYLVALEVDEDEYLADFLGGDGISGEIGVLHHLGELVRLDGEGAPCA